MPVPFGKTFPTLYKKTSTGAIQYWSIHIGTHPDYEEIAQIHTAYGQVDGKEQYTIDDISKGKNVGKKNETTPHQQAEAEAQAKWEKQLKKGYVQTVEDAKDGSVDSVIEGGVVPMLAQKFSEHAHKITYPCYTQPKLDGIRCIAIIDDGAVTLWSRTRKPIRSCPHIVQELEALFEGKTLTLDGELYNHEYKSNFEKIVSLVRQEKPDPEHYLVQYHIYDMVAEATFGVRSETLQKWLEDLDESSSLKVVQTSIVSNEDNVMYWFDLFKKMGYEGSMLRNGASKYVNKRSYDLQKVKEFDDAEFDIIGIEEGRGKLQGHVGAFRCRGKGDSIFLAKMSGDTDRLRDYFQNHKLWQGKKLTVQYQGLTGKEKVPRFPVGLRIRENE
jgi:DNA ligase-1